MMKNYMSIEENLRYNEIEWLLTSMHPLFAREGNFYQRVRYNIVMIV